MGRYWASASRLLRSWPVTKRLSRVADLP